MEDWCPFSMLMAKKCFIYTHEDEALLRSSCRCSDRSPLCLSQDSLAKATLSVILPSKLAFAKAIVSDSTVMDVADWLQKMSKPLVRCVYSNRYHWAIAKTL